MRLLRLFLSSAACLGLAACTAASGMDVLQIAPSNEITSSIPRPANDVGADETASEDAAAAGMTALADDEAQTSPALEKVAMLTVPNPAPRPQVTEGRKIYRHRFRDAEPVNFGSSSPSKLAVHGVDVSRWQGEIDWPKLRTQGANFAYIKATDGGDHLDPKFMDNWHAAEAAGIRRGAYHFFYWCRTASSQADWFIRNVPKVKGALPPVLDVEWNHGSSCKKRPSRDVVLEKMRVFMDRLERHYGQKPIIYTSPDFYEDNLQGAFNDHAFWLRAVAEHPSKVYPGRDWLFWQYSGSGLSHGVDGRVDLNAFHGGESEWHRWVARATR